MLSSQQLIVPARVCCVFCQGFKGRVWLFHLSCMSQTVQIPVGGCRRCPLWNWKGACLNALPEVLSEAAAIAVPETGGGPDQLVIFVVPKGSLEALDVDDIKAKCQRHIRTEINPLFKLQKVGHSAHY